MTNNQIRKDVSPEDFGIPEEFVESVLNYIEYTKLLKSSNQFAVFIMHSDESLEQLSVWLPEKRAKEFLCSCKPRNQNTNYCILELKQYKEI